MQLERGLQTIGRDRTLVALKSEGSRRTIRLPEIVRAALVEQRRRQRARQLLAGGKMAHSDARLTLKIYAHVIEASRDRAPRAIVRICRELMEPATRLERVTC